MDFANIPSNVKSVEVKGLVKTSDAFVKEQIKEIFKSRNFQEILMNTAELSTRLMALGCFSDIETKVDGIQDTNGSPTKSYKVEMDVVEVKNIGGSVSTDIGNNEGSMSSKLFLRNMLGKGDRLSAEYTWGTKNHTDYRLSFNSPTELDPNKRFNVSLFRAENDFYWSKYKQNETGANLEIMVKNSDLSPFEYLYKDKYSFKGEHTWTYQGTWRQMISASDAVIDVRVQSGHSLKSSLQYTNVIDRRDNKIVPTNGGFLKSSVEVAGIGGDTKFVRVNSDYQYSHTFFKYLTTQLSAAVGFIVPWKRQEPVHISDRFFLGGPLNLRGFETRGAGQHKDGCSLGDSAYWLLGAHLYHPLPFLHTHTELSSWLKTHWFANMGSICSLGSFAHPRTLLADARLSVGGGLVIGFGQMARLELNYVLPVWKKQNDKCVNGIQFGIGIHFN